MTKYVCVCKLLSPHGIRGEMKVMSFMEKPEHLKKIKKLTDAQGKPYEVLSIRSSSKPGIFIVLLQGISSPEEAAVLKGLELLMPRDHFTHPAEDEFYIEDLKGLKVYTHMPKTCDDQPSHTIVTLHHFGAGPVLEIKPCDTQDAHKTFMLPFTKQAVPQINMHEGFVVIDTVFMM